VDGSGTGKAFPTITSLAVTHQVVADVVNKSDESGVLLVETKPMKLVDEAVVMDEVAAPELRFALIVPVFGDPLELVRKKYPPIAVGLFANAEKLTDSDRMSVDSQTSVPLAALKKSPDPVDTSNWLVPEFSTIGDESSVFTASVLNVSV
jgi:hypothetical protein